jgi:hypothetical protein
MFDTALQARFAQSCTDAAFGYARATTAAYAALACRTVEFWTATHLASSGSGSERRDAMRSSRRHAQVPAVREPWPAPAFDLFKLPYPWNAGSNAFAQHFAFAPAAAWWGMFPLRGAPECWPAAFALMTVGIPSSVAWPTAEANVAALDAAEAATESLNNAFASYRSESGYAMAQVISPRKLLAAFLMAPLGATMVPWSAFYPGPGL